MPSTIQSLSLEEASLAQTFFAVSICLDSCRTDLFRLTNCFFLTFGRCKKATQNKNTIEAR